MLRFGLLFFLSIFMGNCEHSKLPDFTCLSKIPLGSSCYIEKVAIKIFDILEKSEISRDEIKNIKKIVGDICSNLKCCFEFTSQQKSEVDMLFRIFLGAVESLKKSCKDFGTEYDIKKLNQLKFKIDLIQNEIRELGIASGVVGEFDKRGSGINVSCELYESSGKLLVEILKKAFKS